MISKKINNLFVLFILLMISSISSDANTNKDITLEECTTTASTLEYYIKNNIPPIINFHKDEILKVTDLINSSLIKKLEAYSAFFRLCYIEQLNEAEVDEDKTIPYNKIDGGLKSMFILMRKIKEHAPYGEEVISILLKYVQKSYFMIINEIQKGKNS